jgi:hypothetical protein
VTATATDALGNSSEFALNVRVVAGAPLQSEYLALVGR